MNIQMNTPCEKCKQKDICKFVDTKDAVEIELLEVLKPLYPFQMQFGCNFYIGIDKPLIR